MKELFGQRLREQRIKHGLTLEQLAEKSELSSNRSEERRVGKGVYHCV